MLPPRCFTCNNFIGHKWNEFMDRKDNSGVYGDLLTSLNLTRICCRRMLLTHVEVIDDILQYSATNTTLDESKTSFNMHNKSVRTISCD
jgi:DNA-directed RNA polymerase subunit N (RpoN/RPB10)